MPTWIEQQKHDQKIWFPRLFKKVGLVTIVFLLTITLSLVAWFNTQQRIEKDARSYFEDEANDAKAEFQRRIQHYIDTLYSVQGLFNAYGDIQAVEWQKYMEALKIKERFPGVEDIYFARYIPKEKKGNFESKLKKELHDPSRSIYPPGDREKYFPVEWMGPFKGPNWNKAGFDIGSDSVRMEAVERSIETGKAAVTGKLALFPDHKIGFALRVPIFRSGMPDRTPEERWRALIGFVSASMTMETLAGSLFSKEAQRDFDFEIFDNGPAGRRGRGGPIDPKKLIAHMLYDDDQIRHFNNPGGRSHYDLTTFLDVAGEEWVFYFSTRPNFHFGSESQFPFFVLISGIVISFLLSGITWSLSTAKGRAVQIADSMIIDLRKSEENLKQKNAFVQLLYVVTAAANESSTLEEALQTCLNEICAHMGWPVGHVYFKSADREKSLYPSAIWYFDQPAEYVSFKLETEKTYFGPGEGLPGMVLEKGEPIYLQFNSGMRNFSRIKVVEQSGIQFGFAIPLLVKDEVAAVVEFFSKKIMEPDASTLEVMAHIGTQLGRVIERKKAEEELDFLATHDPLSLLPNRTLFSDRLQQAIGNAGRNSCLAAVLFVDLDQFKRINDTLGHTIGDLALQEVSKRLQACVRAGDTVARWGGDEFTILFENIINIRNLNGICHKVLNAVSKPFYVEGKEFHISTSIGVTVAPVDGDNVEILLKNADIAMYRAKEKGRNNFQFYSQEMSVDSSEKLELENKLRHAIENQELLLYYQPFVDLKSEKIVGAEALIRWNHPVLGMIPPSKFIPLAEETGLIVPIGDWVLKTACAQNKSWQRMGLPPIRVAVNLSASQFQRAGMVEKVKKALQETALSPRYLELELTESILMQKTDEMISTLGKFHEMGIHISIDDFGTGYSSLSYIKKFPIDTLKIDQSFVRDITTNLDDAALSIAIIAMAHSLNLKVIAEAVETADQMEFFKSRGCDEIQGYYISPPLPPEVFKAFLNERSNAVKTVESTLHQA